MTQPKPQTLEERLKPTHLIEAAQAEQIKETVEQETADLSAQAPEPDPGDDPKAQNPYVFDFEWTDPQGSVWKGRFQTHMPTPLDIIRAGVMQSKLLGGAPKASVDALTDEVAFMVSRLSFCLDERPDWFTDPLSLTDGIPLIQAVFEEVAAFEAYFRQHGKTQGQGTRKS